MSNPAAIAHLEPVFKLLTVEHANPSLFNLAITLSAFL